MIRAPTCGVGAGAKHRGESRAAGVVVEISLLWDHPYMYACAIFTHTYRDESLVTRLCHPNRDRTEAGVLCLSQALKLRPVSVRGRHSIEERELSYSVTFCYELCILLEERCD